MIYYPHFIDWGTKAPPPPNARSSQAGKRRSRIWSQAVGIHELFHPASFEAHSVLTLRRLWLWPDPHGKAGSRNRPEQRFGFECAQLFGGGSRRIHATPGIRRRCASEGFQRGLCVSARSAVRPPGVTGSSGRGRTSLSWATRATWRWGPATTSPSARCLTSG